VPSTRSSVGEGRGCGFTTDSDAHPFARRNGRHARSWFLGLDGLLVESINDEVLSEPLPSMELRAPKYSVSPRGWAWRNEWASSRLGVSSIDPGFLPK
jgi:hypothetical protein